MKKMNLKKAYLAFIGIIVFFVACQQEFDFDFAAEQTQSELEMNENAIEALDMKNLYASMEYMPFDSIPDWAKQKMTNSELDIWKKMSSWFKINYAFIEFPIYQQRKNEILQEISLICQEIDNGKRNDRGNQFTVLCNSGISTTRQIEKLSRSESGGENTKTESFAYTLFSQNGATLTLHVTIDKITYSGGTTYKLQSSSFTTEPYGAEFTGAKVAHVSGKTGELFANAKGVLDYKGKRMKVDVRTTFKPVFQ